MSWEDPADVAALLRAHHYLGPIRKGIAWQDEFGAIVVKAPTARNLPKTWLELARWCIVSREKNAGSQQWAAFVRALRASSPSLTTIVSYSDPSVGHTGALYRACNWWWAPTWHRLRPPPSGNGAWIKGEPQAPKDRWIFPLRHDPARAEILIARDDAALRRMPFARYTEPGGADFRAFLAHTNQPTAPRP